MTSSFRTRFGPLLRQYRDRYHKRLAAEVDWMRHQPSLAEAIVVAARGEDERGKRYRHQTRIKQAALRRAEEMLLTRVIPGAQ